MNGVKRTPLRTCVGCRSQKSKMQLIRVVLSPDGVICIDPSGKMNGRGAYLCRDSQCLEAAIRNHGLEKAFRKGLPDETLSRLRMEIEQIDQ